MSTRETRGEDMAKQKVSAKAVIADLRSGISDADLMHKYGLTSKGLESLFEKLVEKKVLTAAEIADRRSAPSQSVPAERPPAKPLPLQQGAEPEVDPALAEAVADHVRKGTHKSQLMVEFGLSPSQLQILLETLVRLGYLSEEDLQTGKPRKTIQCPHCQETLSEGEPRCPQCGRDPNRPASEDDDGQSEQYDEPIGSEGLSYDRYCAWEDRGNQGTVNAYIQTAAKSLLSPADFFSKLPLDGGYLSPILFGAMSMVVAVLFTALWVQIFSGGFGLLGFIGLFFALSITFALALIFIPIGMFVWSLLVHGTLMALKGAHSGFQTTFRVAAYSSVTTVFSAVPVIGQIASLWGFYLTVIGLRETHETSTGKAAGAVAIPIAVILLLGIVSGGVGSLMGKGAKSGRGTDVGIALQRTGEALPPETCAELDTFVTNVDAAIDGGTVQDAQKALRNAIHDLSEHLKGFKDKRRATEVLQKATQYATTHLAIKAFGEKFGRTKMAELEQQVENLRAELRAQCDK